MFLYLKILATRNLVMNVPCTGATMGLFRVLPRPVYIPVAGRDRRQAGAAHQHPVASGGVIRPRL